MPLLSPETDQQQVAYIVFAKVLLVSPVAYALDGIREALLEDAGVVFVPAGLFVFHVAERYAEKTGKLKRSG